MQLPRQAAHVREYLLIIASVLATAVITALWYPVMPNPLATHWGFNGAPNGFMPRIVDASLMLALIASTWLFVWAAGRADRAAARLMIATANQLAVFFVGLRYLTYAANRDAPTWDQAAALTGVDLLWPLAVSLIAGVVGFSAAQNRPEHLIQTSHVSQSDKDAAPDVFDSYLTARLMTALPVLVVAIGLIVWVLVPGQAGQLVGFLCVLLAVIAALLTRAHVHVDAKQLTVSFGPFHWPRISRPLTAVCDVVVLEVEPLAYGGWGYRLLPGLRAVVIRRGEGIRVSFHNQPDLVVTVDDAPLAALVIARHASKQT